MKLIYFLILIFILGSCSKENNIKNISVTDKEIEIAENEINLNDNIGNELNLLSVSLNKFKNELDKNDSMIIDLRTTKELKETGIIAGASQIDFYGSNFKEKLSELDKNKKYLIYCRSGGRSGQTLGIMKELGFTNVFELKGGMNGWLSSKEKTVNISELNTENLSMNKAMNNMIPKIITLNAKNWEFDQKVIKVKKGEKLIIKVNNVDGLHGIAIPDMRILGDNEIEVDTSNSGEYEFRCLNYCGEGHQDMTGKIIID